MTPTVQTAASRDLLGLALGVLGVIIFSGTFPATRAAVQDLHPFFVAGGRATLAGLIALPLLLLWRAPRPSRRDVGRLYATSLGIVYGFPFLSTWALAHVSASHAGVIAALLPLATAAAAAIALGERPSRGFWIVGALGSATVVAFALRQGGGALHAADVALVAAMLLAALGYTLGADVSRRLGGWQTISWVLVLTLPVNAGIAAVYWPADFARVSPGSVVGFLYVSIFSQYIGFFAWYAGLAMAGVARVGQTQLLQPILTVLFAAVVLGETVEPTVWIFLFAVVALVGIGRKMPVRRAP